MERKAGAIGQPRARQQSQAQDEAEKQARKDGRMACRQVTSATAPADRHPPQTRTHEGESGGAGPGRQRRAGVT